MESEETLKNTTGHEHSMFRAHCSHNPFTYEKKIIVYQQSAKFDSPVEIVLELNADYNDVCRFSGNQDDVSRFGKVIYHLDRKAASHYTQYASVTSQRPHLRRACKEDTKL